MASSSSSAAAAALSGASASASNSAWNKLVVQFGIGTVTGCELVAVEVESPSSPSSLISRVENRLMTSSSVAVLTMTPVEREDPSESSKMDQLVVVDSSDIMFTGR